MKEIFAEMKAGFELLLSFSNMGVIVAICYAPWILATIISEHKILVSEIVKAREDLSRAMMFFESPFHVENTDRNRKLWVEELTKAIAKERCSHKLHDIGTENFNESGIFSQFFCLCVLIGGIIFLAKTIYLEYCAYIAMKQAEAMEESHNKDIQLITVAEFIQYRSNSKLRLGPELIVA